MYFQLVLLRCIFIVSIGVSASLFDSDVTLPLDDTAYTQDALLPLDQTTLASNLFDPSSDSSTAPLFDAQSPSTGFDLSENSDIINPSDLFGGDDMFQVADCSTSEIPPSALGKSRIKRSDNGGGTFCSDTNAAQSPSNDIEVPMLPQEFDQERHSITCWQLTLGMLPFAVVGGDEMPKKEDKTKLYRVTTSNSPYSPSTVYQVSISMRKISRINFVPPPFCSPFFLFHLRRFKRNASRRWQRPFSNRCRALLHPRRFDLLLSTR